MTTLNGKSVLITGGTGSFGTTVAKRLLSQKEVRRVIVFSRDEKKQHDMRLSFDDERLDFEIGDIRDEDRIMRAMSDVDMVFHAAAMKQVPSCEFFPLEAVKTNVIGTGNVLEAAISNNVEKVVVLSTDKAAYPVNAMGCSKMMMEKLMIARAQKQNDASGTVLCGVRYGNVLFSRGSVVPLFVEQIKKGGPLTVTDPNMTRFLMPLPSAIDLVLHALRHGRNGDLFIHKAAASTVETLAKACLRIFGQRNESIDIIGIRAGEKMHETLATAEELARAEDQGDYWRIVCENGHEFARYFSQGILPQKAHVAFTSENAQRLSENEVESLLRGLPEIKNILQAS